MTPEEIKIEEAARIHANLKEGFDREEEEYYNHGAINAYESFKAGVTSEIAKEYWQENMYSKEDVDKIVRESYNYGFEGDLYERTDFSTKQHDCNSINKFIEKYLK